jgi:hypothetical protein
MGRGREKRDREKGKGKGRNKAGENTEGGGKVELRREKEKVEGGRKKTGERHGEEGGTGNCREVSLFFTEILTMYRTLTSPREGGGYNKTSFLVLKKMEGGGNGEGDGRMRRAKMM